MKTCFTCKKEKDETEFSKLSRAKDGLNYRCKSCVREYQQTDAFKKYIKAYQQTDAYKEKHTERQKAYQQTDAYKEYKKAYKLRKKKAAASAGKAAPSSDTQPLGAQ